MGRVQIDEATKLKRSIFAFGLTAWMMLICFGYYYKAVVCGSTHLMGLRSVCFTIVHGVDLNHWFETLIYVPVIWLALYQVHRIVFARSEAELANDPRHRMKSLVGSFAIAMWLYGAGIHITNLVEIWAREHNNVSSGTVYELVYFLDETFSHYFQFIAFFFAIGWFICHDRLGRTEGARFALFMGLAHGVERAVGTIEGSSAHLLLPLVAWIALACWWRLRRYQGRWRDAWSDYFFRYGVGFSLSAPLAQGLYYLLFGGFVQPSEMGSDAVWVFVFTLTYMVILASFFLILDARLKGQPAK